MVCNEVTTWHSPFSGQTNTPGALGSSIPVHPGHSIGAWAVQGQKCPPWPTHSTGSSSLVSHLDKSASQGCLRVHKNHFQQQLLPCWGRAPQGPSRCPFTVTWDHGTGGATGDQWCKAAPLSPFQGFFRVGSHMLIHSWLFPRADSTHAAQVPLVPHRHTENIKPQLLDKP